MEHETIVEVYSRLNKLGYTSTCRAQRDGLFLQRENRLVRAEDVVVDDVIRLEGTSAPSEEVMVFALSAPDKSWRATYCVTHGPELGPEDVAMMQALDLRRARRSGAKVT